MKTSLRVLASAGVTALAITCNFSHAADFGINDYVVSTSKNVDWVPQYRYDVCGSLKPGASSSTCTTWTDYARTASTVSLGAVNGSAYAFAGPTGNWGGTTSTVESYWWDTITITSAWLAAGTVVTVTGQIDMTASVVPSRLYPSPYTRAQAQLNWGGPDAYNFVTVRTDQNYPTTGSFQALVGSSYAIFGKYMISTGTSAHDGVDLGSVDASARYALWVDNPAASYTSASGVNYAPVPEPASLPLMLLGLATVVGGYRRRRLGS